MKNAAPLRFLRTILRKDASASTSDGPRCHDCDLGLEKVAMGEQCALRCPGCGGSWLEATTLTSALTAGQVGSQLLAFIEQDGEADIGHTFAPSRLKRACPACTVSMENERFEETGIWIDACPQGHGIWLDRGELRLLREARAHRATASESDNLEDTVSSLLLDFL